MVPTLGRTLILLALLAASAGSIVGFATGARPSAAGWKWARRLAYAFAAFMALANVTMEYALLTHDFSVSYVAHVGSRSVPTWVSIVSLWSSLEGSILFWGLVMGVYVSVATWRKAGDHPEYMPYAVGVWLACGAFFSFLLAGPAQPFATIPNPALDGPGPNPLLQNHYLMVIHPPFLYSGYVGMTIPFGLACAALLVGRLGNDFIRPLRNFLLVSWIFLTCAIVLGGWWAYEVLGWGGYWAWDPVENASFLPWLVATAALHSALLVEFGLTDGAGKMPHPVGLHPKRQINGVGRHILEVIGAIVVGGTVLIGRADALERLEVVVVEMFAAVEHQMLEQVGEPRPPRFFIFRAHMVPNVDGHDRRLVVLVHEQRQSVFQHEPLIRDGDGRRRRRCPDSARAGCALRRCRCGRHDA